MRETVKGAIVLLLFGLKTAAAKMLYG